MLDYGSNAYKTCSDLFSLCRSLTGQGTVKTLAYIQDILPDTKISSVPSGYQAFDWTVPDEWNISDAYIECLETGERVIDFQKSNLHVIGYSIPVDQEMSFEELDKYLHSLPNQPDAIPYIASYYVRRWGFCLSDKQRIELAKKPQKRYHIKIDSSLEPGTLNYGELYIPGNSDEEVLLSTYVCHPSMANNELSGPSIAIEIARWLNSLTNRKLSYRILFLVETIGSLVYLSKNLKHLKNKVKAGFVLTCLGDNGDFSMLHSRYGNTYSDRVAASVIRQFTSTPKVYSFLERGSDERQYCAPGIDLPVCTLCRTKFGEYPEYHTSLDNLSFISEEGLKGGFDFVQSCIKLIENDGFYKGSVLGEPQLGKRGLYPTLSTKDTKNIVRNMMDLIAYADGENDLVKICEITNIPPNELIGELIKLLRAGILVKKS